MDDDDEWIDADKLKKQVEFLGNNRDYVLVGGGIKVNPKSEIRNPKQTTNNKPQITKLRVNTDTQIRKTMLFRNNFFTSTVMFRKDEAFKVGGFIKDDIDLAEDYDLWLRMGKLGKMYNFQEVFTAYRVPSYNKGKFKEFLRKQRRLIKKHKSDYPFYFLSSLIIWIRLLF